MKSCFVSVMCALPLLAISAVSSPEVSDVVMSQNGGGKMVTVSYRLQRASAVITFDVQTNTPTGWVSVGADVLSSATGDVWKVVSDGSDAKVIRWPARAVWPDHAVSDGNARAVVTAWPLDDTPDYLVVDLAANASQRVFYYPSAEALPGGLLADESYRKNKVVMRRIHARGITWAMGSAYEYGKANDHDKHLVTLANDYYIGVFPMTQAQCGQVYVHPTQTSKFLVDGDMRPMEYFTSYYYVRDVKIGYGAATDYYYPHAPNPDSFIGLMRRRTDQTVDFELPSEAQWEYACRAGTVEDQWNTGVQSVLTMNQVYVDPSMPGRNCENQATANNTSLLTDQGPSNCTAIVGTYAPNAWGIYDMHGNVREWCLDWYAAYDVTLNGAPNCNGECFADGKTRPADARRVLRGGSWKQDARSCLSAMRSYSTQDARTTADIGFRVVCRMGLR